MGKGPRSYPKGGNYRGPRIGTGGGGGGTKGGGAKGGSTSSSSVHDGIKILVVSIATGVAIVVAGVAGFIVWGYAA